MAAFKTSTKIALSPHFIERWHQYIGRAKQTKIKSKVHNAIQESGLKGRKCDGTFEVIVCGHKAILGLQLDNRGRGVWVALGLLSFDSAEMELERSGLGDVARKLGRKLNCWGLGSWKEEDGGES